MKKRVLILCTGNSARSQMAEGLLRHDAGDKFEVESAGTKPSLVRPEAITVMKEISIDISAQRSKHVDEFNGQRFDYVITVCDNAKEACPVFFGQAERLHHDFEDPATVEGSETERLTVFRRVRDELRDYLHDFSAQQSQRHSCCAHDMHMSHHSGHKKSSFATAAHATLHCLTGCVIGEFIGLAIGVSLGILPYPMMALSTVLAYISGFSLAIFPLMRKTGFNFPTAFKTIWLGEAISIGVMELIMNAVDYHMGGIRSGSLTNPLFWEALAMAVPAGYVAAFPVNAWLIGKEMKRCH